MEVAASLLQWPKYLQSSFLHSFTAFTDAVWGGGKSEERAEDGRVGGGEETWRGWERGEKGSVVRRLQTHSRMHSHTKKDLVRKHTLAASAPRASQP